MWRVQDSLAVSRAIGDMNMKEWIISEPEIRKIHLTTDCESLILASDGLWDKVCLVLLCCKCVSYLAVKSSTVHLNSFSFS